MSRKSLLMGIGLLLLLTSSVSAGLVLLVRHEPDFYLRCAFPPGPDRQQHSKAFQTQFSQFFGGISAHEDRWYAEFKQEDINSYFDEDFVRSGAASMLPAGISAPRVEIDSDRIRLAFRYGTGKWSAIVSVDIRMWLIKREPNVVALELEGLHAGSLPISAQSLLDRVEEMAHQHHIEVTWYRHNGNPVALLRFQADRPHPTVQLQQLRVEQGKITIDGRSLEPLLSPLRAMLETEPTAPAAD
jgi:hypothetical protein